jgi:hypothetical protein
MIPGLYTGNPRAYFDDDSRTFMARDAGKRRHGEHSIEDRKVRVTNSRGFIFD